MLGWRRQDGGGRGAAASRCSCGGGVACGWRRRGCRLDLGPRWADRALSGVAAGGASGIRGEGGYALCLVRATRHGGMARRPDLEEVVLLPILGGASASMELGGAVGRAVVLHMVRCY
jgi:hypothetical protein